MQYIISAKQQHQTSWNNLTIYPHVINNTINQSPKKFSYHNEQRLM